MKPDPALPGARFRDISFTPFWPETAKDIAQFPPLQQDLTCDLAIIGGGFTGLWAALKARERFPQDRIVVLDAQRCGDAGSGRNGGFCAPSISHGVSNALSRWPGEAETLVRLGRENLDALEADLANYGVEGEFERPGKLNVAATPWQAEALKALQRNCARFGVAANFLEGDALHERIDSPCYMAGLFEPNYALLNPGKVVAGLSRCCADRDVDIHEGTPVTGIAAQGQGVRITSPAAQVFANRVVLATNAAPPLLKRHSLSVVPVFDYTLMTEPLTAEQMSAIGWTKRHGIADSGNRFQYSRKTDDDRILWGGFDAIYHFGSKRDEALYHRPESYLQLQANFDKVFPALSDVSFSHAWGGIIDSSARTTVFAGKALGGRVAYALGFTGQGVSASRFAALTMLDLLSDTQSERTELRMLSRRPVPFPPEPVRALAIAWVQADLAREDETGHRSLLLRSLDRLGIGFDS